MKAWVGVVFLVAVALGYLTSATLRMPEPPVAPGAIARTDTVMIYVHVPAVCPTSPYTLTQGS